MDVRRLALIATFAVTAMACGRTLHDLTAEKPAGPEMRALPDVDAIYVTDGDLAIPHRPVALVATAPLRPEQVATEGYNALRAQAHRVGAHAVIRVQSVPELTEEITYRPGELSRLGTEWVTLQRLRGIAVIFEDPSEEPWPAHFDINIPPSP